MMTRSRFIIQPDWAGKPIESDVGGWPVIERFDPAEKDCEACITDMTHRPKAILYGPALRDFKHLTTGQSVWTGQGFLSLVKPEEAVFFGLTGPMELSLSESVTDMTDAWVLLSIWGAKAVEILQRLLPVDLDSPAAREPFYLVTRWHALVVHVLNLKAHESCFLLATDRSHGQNLFDGLIHAGRHLGLRPVGQKQWQHWFERLSFSTRS
jgi:hypothetical protein